MATSMNYSVVARKNPSKKDEPSKYCLLYTSTGSYTESYSTYSSGE